MGNTQINMIVVSKSTSDEDENDNDRVSSGQQRLEMKAGKDVVDDKIDNNNDENEDEEEKEKEKIIKGISFWKHPALQSISPAEKRAYLHERQGMTDIQIHKVWEEILNDHKFNGEDIINNNNNDNNYYQGQEQEQQRRYIPMMTNPVTSNPLPDAATMENTRDENANIDLTYSNNNAHPQHQQKQYSQYNNNILPIHNNNNINNRNRNDNINNRYNQDPFTHQESEDEGPISVGRGISLIAAGSFLGLTGAAAIRWLNGGEFDLLPPPKQNERTITTNSSTFTNKNERQERCGTTTLDRQEEKDGEENGNADEKKIQWNNNDNNKNGVYDDNDNVEYSDVDEDDIEQCLLERMQNLLASIDSNSTLQERLIHKLVNTSTITDHSMNLLKNNDIKVTQQQQHNKTNILDTSVLASDLIEIKHGFKKLLCKNNNNNNDTTTDNDDGKGDDNDIRDHLQKKSSELLIKLDNFIQKMKRVEDNQQHADDQIIVTTTSDDSPTTITSKTIASSSSEKILQQGIPISYAPSTPVVTNNKQIIDPFTLTADITTPLSLQDCIIKIAGKNDANTIKIGSQLLYLYLTNLSTKPNNQRYRKIYTSNESFQKIENMIGGKDLLQNVGFVEDIDKGILEWIPSTKSTGQEQDIMSSMILVKEAIAALGILKSSSSDAINGKGDSGTEQTIQLALSKLSLPTQPSPQQEYDNNGNDVDGNDKTHSHHHDIVVPQTPIGSSLVSPPLPKKIPYDFASPSP